MLSAGVPEGEGEGEVPVPAGGGGGEMTHQASGLLARPVLFCTVRGRRAGQGANESSVRV